MESSLFEGESMVRRDSIEVAIDCRARETSVVLF